MKNEHKNSGKRTALILMNANFENGGAGEMTLLKSAEFLKLFRRLTWQTVPNNQQFHPQCGEQSS